jgi:hypothetical protein
MNIFRYSPLASFANAFRSVLGRGILVGASAMAGFFLGGWYHSGSLAMGNLAEVPWGALFGMLPMLALVSLFTPVGIVTIPATLIFTICFVRSQWPLGLVLIVAVLVAWNVNSVLSQPLLQPHGLHS